MLDQNKTEPLKIGRSVLRRVSYGALLALALLFTVAFYAALIWGAILAVKSLANLISS